MFLSIAQNTVLYDQQSLFSEKYLIIGGYVTKNGSLKSEVFEFRSGLIGYHSDIVTLEVCDDSQSLDIHGAFGGTLQNQSVICGGRHNHNFSDFEF